MALKDRVDVLISQGDIEASMMEDDSHEDDIEDIADGTEKGANENTLCPGEIE